MPFGSLFPAFERDTLERVQTEYHKTEQPPTPDVELHNTPRNRGLTYVFHGAVEVMTDGATTTVKFK